MNMVATTAFSPRPDAKTKRSESRAESFADECENFLQAEVSPADRQVWAGLMHVWADLTESWHSNLCWPQLPEKRRGREARVTNQ